MASQKGACPHLPDWKYAGLSARQDAHVFSSSCCPRKCLCRILALCGSALVLQASEPVSARVYYSTTLTNFFVCWDRERGQQILGEREGEKHTVAEKKVLPTVDKLNMFKRSPTCLYLACLG